MIETFDIFDINLNPAPPFLATRNEAHAKGLWHQVFHCWIMRRDESGGKMLLQLRSGNKKNNPSKLDISAAGHLLTGETPADGVRELQEELGISVSPDDLLYLGALRQTLDLPDYLDREICHTYFHETSCPLSGYTPQKEEVDGVFEISISDALNLFSRQTDKIEAEGIFQQNGKYLPQRRFITIDDMSDAKDRTERSGYYLKIFTLAELYLQGRRDLAI
jgi:isopentenyldiphosphate isomerase